MALSFNEVREILAVCNLRIPVVYHLIEELIDNDEVISDGLLLKFLEIVNKDVDKLV